MAILRRGVFNASVASGEWACGVGGVGAPRVDGGEVLAMTSGAPGGPHVRVGRLPEGNGTLTVTGAGSAVEVTAAGSTVPGEGAALQIGRDAAVGLVRVLDGGALRIVDPALPASPFAGGEEFVNVGRAGTGTLVLRAGEVELRGTGAGMNIGSEGGTGRLTVAESSQLSLVSAAPGPGHLAVLRIGPDGGTGSTKLDRSTVVVENRGAFEACVAVGREATGRLEILGTGAADHGLFLHGGSDSFAFLDIGRGPGGDGRVAASGATLRLQNDGVGFDGVLRGEGGQAVAMIGRDGGRGSLELAEGALPLLDGTVAFLDVGLGGGLGRLSADAATIRVDGGDDFAAVAVGWGGGARGEVTLAKRSVATVTGLGTALAVGFDGGESGGTFALATSALTLRGDEIAQVALGSSPFFGAFEPGLGALEMTRRATLTIEGGSEARLDIDGGPGGIGAMSVARNASVVLAAAEEARVRIGFDGGTGGLALSGAPRSPAATSPRWAGAADPAACRWPAGRGSGAMAR